MSYVKNGTPIGGTGGTALPTASGAGQVPVSAGAGTTYAATTAGDVVDAAIASVVGAVAGQAIVGDGLGGVTETSADVSAVLAAANAAAALDALLPRATTGDALHHHRLDQSSTLADLGSGAVTATLSGAGWTQAGHGPYRGRKGLGKSSSSTGDSARIATTIPAADFSFAVTLASRTGAAPSGVSWIVMVWDESTNPIARNYVSLLTNSAALFIGTGKASGVGDSSTWTPGDWGRARRVVVTYDATTRLATLYGDGASRATITAPATLGACSQVSLLGAAGDPFSVGSNGDLVISDAQVWTRKLSATEARTDWQTVAGSLL